MPWSKTGTTHYHAQLGLSAKGRAINGLVGRLDLLNFIQWLFGPDVKVSLTAASPVWGKIFHIILYRKKLMTVTLYDYWLNLPFTVLIADRKKTFWTERFCIQLFKTIHTLYSRWSYNILDIKYIFSLLFWLYTFDLDWENKALWKI